MVDWKRIILPDKDLIFSQVKPGNSSYIDFSLDKSSLDHDSLHFWGKNKIITVYSKKTINGSLKRVH